MIAAITDAYDGKIARKHNIVTKFGIFFDPLADKFLSFICILCIYVLPGIIHNCETLDDHTYFLQRYTGDFTSDHHAV